MADTVKKALGLEEVPTVYWSDSTTGLSRIRRDEDWGSFVGNRVREVLKISKKENWRHVPDKINPANLSSIGCSLAKLVETSCWEGSDWLCEAEVCWPKFEEESDEEKILEEKKKICDDMYSSNFV